MAISTSTIYKSSIFTQFDPVIEFVDPSSNNPRDIKKITLKCKGDPTETIKWCRRNFGQRGDGWDFAGGTQKNMEIFIWNSKLITMYEMFRNE